MFESSMPPKRPPNMFMLYGAEQRKIIRRRLNNCSSDEEVQIVLFDFVRDERQVQEALSRPRNSDGSIANATVSMLLGHAWRNCTTRETRIKYEKMQSELAKFHRVKYPDYKYLPTQKRGPKSAHKSKIQLKPAKDPGRQGACGPAFERWHARVLRIFDRLLS